ncbi:MAG: hypothetical protein IKP40_08050 [Clostridia bacterium]|nr:hypothetical protein [Clostridia bacterium]
MPQLTSSGDVRAEAKTTWLDDGALRVVPDRNEQHTFKERMRGLGSWCVIDVTVFAPEASKIRTNKNYRPDRGENNQYIIYSDAVTAVPGRVFYEVIEGAPASFADAARVSITPRFYLREKDTYYGPVSRENPAMPQPAPEMEAALYEFDAPDGKMHTVLCVASENLTGERRPMFGRNFKPHLPEAEPVKPTVPETPAVQPVQEAKPAAAPVIPADAASQAKMPESAEKLPIGETLHILDESLTFEETVEGLNKPLSKDANLIGKQASMLMQPHKPSEGRVAGTPLYHTPISTSSPQPRDRLQEVVSNQSRAARSEPYAEPLPGNAKLKPVNNPIEQACVSFRKAWESFHSRPQLVNCVMALDGMKALLERRQQSDGASRLQAALQKHLHDLETERLSVLVQLDEAKTEQDAYRAKAVAEAAVRERRELEDLQKQRQELEEASRKARAEMAVLDRQRKEIEKELQELTGKAVPMEAARILREHQLNAAITGRILQPAPGEPLAVDGLCERLKAACEACDVPYNRNAAIAFLTLMAVCSRLTIAAEEPAPLATVIHNMVDALGWGSAYAVQEDVTQQFIIAGGSAETTPALVLSLTDERSVLPGACRIMLVKDAADTTASMAYAVSHWPVVKLPKMDMIRQLDAANTAVSLKSILDTAPAISPEDIDKLLHDLYVLVPRISGEARDQMNRFIGICAALMDGGIAGAVDWAIRLWLLPSFAGQTELCEALKPLLYEYPLTLQAIS